MSSLCHLCQIANLSYNTGIRNNVVSKLLILLVVVVVVFIKYIYLCHLCHGNLGGKYLSNFFVFG